MSGSDDKALTVRIVNAWESFGGAALAANRLYRALRASGVDASMLVHGRSSDDPHVHLPDYDAVDPACVSEREKLIGQELASAPAFTGLGTFTLDRSVQGPGLVEAIRPETDIVNLHWVGNFIDWELFFAPGRITAPVVWTLHDMRALTGGCHYAGTCRHYMTGCGNCPYFTPAAAEDISSRAVIRQRRALEDWGGALHVVTPSRWLAEEAGKSAVLGGVPVTVIPNSVDLEEFSPRSQAAARAVLGLPEDAKVVFFVAHDLGDSRKGAPHLVEALSRLEEVGGIHLVTAGARPPEVPAFVTHLPTGLSTDSAQLGRLYAAADLVVLPTLEDNLPNVILEAFASGRPVVGYDVGGVPDHVIDGVTGFLVPYADAAALAEALRGALADRGRLAALGGNCRAHAEREFAPEIQAARYRALFRALLIKDRGMNEIVASGTFDEVFGVLAGLVGTYPRRQPGQVVINGTPIDFVDLHSLYYQLLQIFRGNFYAFESSVPDPLIIDCGANIGMASLYFAANIPGVVIEAYEADPEIAAVLDGNLKRWGVAATLRAAAVWLDDGGVSFVNSHDDSGFVSDQGGAGMITVPSVRLRDHLAGRRVEMLKLDVEGAEYDLLTDCDGALDGVQKMIIETHQMQDGKNRIGEMLAVLERNGFRYVPIDLNQATWIPVSRKPPFGAVSTDRFLITFLVWRP